MKEKGETKGQGSHYGQVKLKMNEEGLRDEKVIKEEKEL